VRPEQKLLTILSFLAVFALLIATLWPFNPYPRNEVSWLKDSNGIRFNQGGNVVSIGSLQPQVGADAGDSCAIEIYLRPVTRKDTWNLLTFSSAENPVALYLRQFRGSLLVDRSRAPHEPGPKLTEFEVHDAMRLDKLVLVTVSFGPDGTVAYVDGKFNSSSQTFRVRRHELYGQIVLGSSPRDSKGWEGEIHGLAIYDDQISAGEAAAHYAEWTGRSSFSSLKDASHVIALYDFRERGGNVIRSEVGSAPALTIAERFSLPRKRMLESVTNEFEWTAGYRRDVTVNIIGFIPLGLVLGGLFGLSRSRGQAILISTICGGILSFLIEFLQYYIPQRGSGWTDVVTNTTGTFLGALIAHPDLVRWVLRFMHFIPPGNDAKAIRS
jgi:hypothetical protein